MAIETPAARFKAFRTQLGLTGHALAFRLGVTKTAVSYWESGRVALSPTACLLAEALFRISASWLQTGQEPMWLHHPATGLPDTPDILLIRQVNETAFLSDGTLLPPRELAPCLGLPRDYFSDLLHHWGIGSEYSFFRGYRRDEFTSIFQTSDYGSAFVWFRPTRSEGLEPVLRAEDWVLLYTGSSCRRDIRDHCIYLVRLQNEDRPVLRRLATDPMSGDILLGIDLPGRVPLRMNIPPETRLSVILGLVCWVGGTR